MNEPVSETAELESEARLNSVIALLVALTGTFMALAGVKDGNISSAMAEAQARAVDTWTYYQAKSMKQNLAEATIDHLSALRDLSVNRPESRASLDRRIDDHANRTKRYEREKNEVRVEAERYENRYRELSLRGDQFDLCQAALSVALALLGITALTRRRWLLGVAIVIMAFGFLFGLAGFSGWTLHPDFLMKWLS